MSTFDNEFSRLKRDVRTLLGINANGGKIGKAITVPKAPYIQKSKAITQAPTQDDYNALVQDIALIFKILTGA